MTIRGGEAFDGGAIFNEGTVILKNVNIIDNEAFNQGGGIFNARGAVLNATNASISSNIAGSRGGAVNNLGTSTYLNTTFSTNIAVSRGGGIFNEGTATSRLINVTIARNTAASRGAGLASEAAQSQHSGQLHYRSERHRRTSSIEWGNNQSGPDGSCESLGEQLHSGSGQSIDDGNQCRTADLR